MLALIYLVISNVRLGLNKFSSLKQASYLCPVNTDYTGELFWLHTVEEYAVTWHISEERCTNNFDLT